MANSLTILGGGFAGLAAAQRGRENGFDVALFEKNLYLGGHASSANYNGFVFDEGPHVSFTKLPEIKKLLEDGVKGDFIEFSSIVNNYFKGHWVKHPVQAHMFGLPTDIVTKCILGFVNASRSFSDSKPAHYSEWLIANFGKEFSEEFPYRYTRKYWTVEPSEMTTEWIGPRMYRPNLEEVVRGAVEKVEENKHYIPEFRYPRHGGFGTYANALMSDASYHLGCAVESINTSRKVIRFADGQTHEYENLVSSLPLPELIARIENAPQSIRDAVEKLVCTSVALVDVGVGRADGFPPGHWQYFYDEDICFARASYPHLLSPTNVPDGCGSIQVEVYYTKHKPLPYSDVLNKAIEDMHKCGMLQAGDDVRISQSRLIKYANVLFNHDRETYLPKVNSYLDELGIKRCGRYGLWNYHWTDESIVSGYEAADQFARELSA